MRYMTFSAVAIAAVDAISATQFTAQDLAAVAALREALAAEAARIGAHADQLKEDE